MDVFYKSQLDILTNIPLTPSLNHQLFFSSVNERDKYFDTHIKISWNDFKYIREENTIKIAGTETEYYNVNYIRFKNNETNGMWIYAFVLSTEYVNLNTTRLNFKVDAWQTYFNFLTIKDCDIERTHVNTDDWQSYVLNEGLDVGDYRLFSDHYALSFFSIDGALIMSTIDLVTSGGTVDNPIINSATGGLYNGSPSACSLYYTTDIRGVMSGLSEYPWVAGGIIGIYSVSSQMFNGGFDYQNSRMGFSIGVIGESSKPRTYNGFMSLSHLLPNVVNKKLWVYPYSYFDVVSTSGDKITLKPELISGDKIEANIICSLIPTPSLLLTITNYMGVESIDLTAVSLTFNSFPSFPCINDQYTLAKEQAKSMENLIASQNRQNLQRELYGGFGRIIGSGFSGDVGQVVNATVNSVESVANGAIMEQQRAERARLSQSQIITAPQLCGNSNASSCASILAFYPTVSFLIRSYTLIPPMLNNIDRYFTVYGYKVNQIITPNFTRGSRRYRYIKCNHVNMYGNIPQVFLEEIRAMFLQGVTLWYDYENVGVY